MFFGLCLPLVPPGARMSSGSACLTIGSRASLSGRSVATVAEICFAAQWAIILYQLGTMTGADTTVNAAWVILPLIVIAECFSWYAVLTTHYLGNAIENSIWGRRPSSSSGLAFAGCYRSFTARFASPSSSPSSESPAYLAFLMAIGRPDVPETDGGPRLGMAASFSDRLRGLRGRQHALGS